MKEKYVNDIALEYHYGFYMADSKDLSASNCLTYLDIQLVVIKNKNKNLQYRISYQFFLGILSRLFCKYFSPQFSIINFLTVNPKVYL